jgi:hypothetical protein
MQLRNFKAETFFTNSHPNNRMQVFTAVVWVATQQSRRPRHNPENNNPSHPNVQYIVFTYAKKTEVETRKQTASK